MEKISGIIPSSARVQAVDLREANPVRPGTPTFGRPEGVSSLRAETTRPDMRAETTANRGVGIQKEQMDWRSKESREAALAADLSNKFFLKNRKEAGPVNDVEMRLNTEALKAPVSSVTSGFRTDGIGPNRGIEIEPVDDQGTEPMFEETPQQQPEGLYPKGSFLDRSV